MLNIRQIEFNSAEYNQSIELRDKILRKPLGMVYTTDFLAAEKDQYHIAAFDNEKIVGVLLLKKIDEQTLQMRQVAVDDTLQGKGIGRQMVEFCEKFSKEKGFAKIILHARKVAVGFYLKLDYKITTDEFMEIGIPHYEMTKILN